jgi:hypothetical protein
MALTKDITNSLRSKSTIRLTGDGTTTIYLANLASEANETVSSAAISVVISSTNGTWTVKRGADTAGAGGYTVLQLWGENYLPLTQSDIAISGNSTANIVCTNNGANGTLILQVTKEAQYATPLTGL